MNWSGDSRLGPDPKANRPKDYCDVLLQYQQQPSCFPELDPSQAAKLVAAITTEGVPNIEYQGRKLGWRRGLSAFCSTEEDVSIGQLAEGFSSALVELFRVLSDKVDSVEFGPEYLDHPKPKSPFPRGTHLAPGMEIHNRELLTDGFIAAVLKPYHVAKLQVVEVYTKRLQKTHEDGSWVMLRPGPNGRLHLVLPGEGFNQRGSYRIPRTSIMRGYGCSDEELEPEIFPVRPPDFDVEALLFLSADHLNSFWKGARNLVPEAPAKDVRQKPGRPEGSGFDQQDGTYIARMGALIAQGKSNSHKNAAEQIVKQFENEIAGSSFDAKVSRLARKSRAQI